MPPEPAGPDPLAVAAFIVSICSASVAFVGVVWQLTLYRLSGARLKVQLVFCYTDDVGHMTWSTTGRGRPTFADVRAGMDRMSDLGIEYGRVRVTNVGRTAVSVENISFSVRRRFRLTFRRRRTTIQPYQFLRKGLDPKDLTPDVANPIRLEPGGHVTAEFYLWPALSNGDHGTRAGAISVRGSAQAVGGKWATRSKRRTAWKLPAGATSYFSDVEVTPELRMFRELWSHQHRAGLSASWALLMRREINKRLAEGATSQAIQEYLDEGMERLDDEAKYMGNVLLSFAVHREYHNDPPPPALSCLRRALYGVTGVPPWLKPPPPR